MTVECYNCIIMSETWRLYPAIFFRRRMTDRDSRSDPDFSQGGPFLSEEDLLAIAQEHLGLGSPRNDVRSAQRIIEVGGKRYVARDAVYDPRLAATDKINSQKSRRGLYEKRSGPQKPS